MKSSSLFLCAAAVLALHTAATGQFVLGTDGDLGMDDGEITPDGRYGVVRMNGWEGSLRVYDMPTGQLVETHQCQQFNTPILSGPNQDGVAVTDERCIVIGNCALIGDLTAVGTPGFLLGHHDIGVWALDVAITPNGELAAVRGGADVGSNIGGLFVFDLQDGSLEATAPGTPSDPFTFTTTVGLDSVVASDTHAVFLSLGGTNPPTTRVTIMGLRQGPGGTTSVVYETAGAAGPDRDLDGAPSDLVLLPGGQHAAVRSEFEIVLFALGAQSGPVWRRVPLGNPGPMSQVSMDTIVASADRVATTSFRLSSGTAQLDLLDLAGNQVSAQFPGAPHDLAVTPTGERVIVRTHSNAELFDMTTDPSGGSLIALDSTTGFGSLSGWNAGLDSVETDGRHAVMIFSTSVGTKLHAYDIRQDTFQSLGTFDAPERATDLALTPDGTRAVVACDTYLMVADLRSRNVSLTWNKPGTGPFPWSDGVVADDAHALVWGVDAPQGGWVTVVDLFAQPDEFCAPRPNSTGVAAGLHATGSASVGSNDLTVWATDLPAARTAAFVYSSGKINAPFGDRLSCVAGTVFRFPLTTTQNGIVAQTVDVTGAPSFGGAITAGSTWHFQGVFQDGQRRNTTPGLTIDFVP